MPTFAEGARVSRIEDRAQRGATVISAEQAEGEAVYLIAYDEGGEGWWPEDALESEPSP